MATITAVKERINLLNQANFQILCDALLAREGYPGIVSLGTKDGAEKTTPGTPDTYFCLSSGKYVFVEYTTQKEGLSAKIHTDIDKCFDEECTKIPLCEIDEIVYCHTSSSIKPKDDRALKSICEEKGIKLTLIGIDSLAERLMNYPTIIKDHLGICIDSEQIQTVEDFIKQYDSNAMAATLNTVFLFREKETDAIDKAFENVNVVLLIGPAGTGKTRLALEYAKNHASLHNERLFCIHDRSIRIYEDLKLYFEKPGNYFIFVDDANQLSELKLVIEYVHKVDSGYHVHILMTVRDYAISKVEANINEITHYKVVNIAPFSDEEIISLMKNHYDIQNPDYLDRIVQIAEGNARIAMLTGKIASDANCLDSINDVSNLYANYFGKVLSDTGVDKNIKLLVSAGIMAFLNAIHLDHIEPIMPILDEKGLSKADFVENIHVLHKHEFVDICNDKGVHFSEQCMANFVLKYVFFDKKVIGLSKMIEVCFDPYHGRTVYAVNTLLNVFQNTELQNYVKKEILDLWKKFEDENSPIFREFLKTFFNIDEIKALIIIRDIIGDAPAITINAEDINTEEGKNYINVSDDIITILGGFSHSDNIDAALDLFFQYYLKRPDLYIQFYHASTSYFSIDKNAEKRGYQTQIKYITKLVEYSQNGNDSLITLLFCDVASHFLKLEFSPHENTRNGKGLMIYHIPVESTQSVKEYRGLIWKQLLVLASKYSYCKSIKDILFSYGKGIHDCNEEVIKSEAKYICRLSKLILSPERLTDCLIARSLQDVFEASGYQTSKLRPFFSSSKYRLYQLINGPEYNLDISFEECEKKKADGIRRFMLSATNKLIAFEEILQIFIEIVSEKGIDMYGISKGIDIALQSLTNNKDDYIQCVTMLLSAETISGINTLQIVKTLFSLLTPQEVFDLLNSSNSLHKNEWMYAYYHEIPQQFVNQIELDGLYKFLMDDSDQDIKSSPYRDIDFLNKYLPIDADVIYRASKIILDKQTYSPFIVCLYFELQFNKHHIDPKEVIGKFAQDIKLLERIYVCVIENSHLVDYGSALLQELFNADKSFVKKYIGWFVKNSEEISSSESNSIYKIFYQEDKYIDIFNFIVNESIASLSSPYMAVPRIIKQLLEHPNTKEEHIKCDLWIKHFIKNYSTDKDRMHFLFEAIAEISIEQSVKYIVYLVECNGDYDVFDKIPLTPLSNPCSGSCVPLYSSWVDQLQELCQIFTGIKFIKHLNKVQQQIEYCRRRIEEEEISDIIRG